MNRTLQRSLVSVLLMIAGVGLAGAAPLELEVKIPLGEIRGRIDHMAVDLGRNRLYVAELGNDSVSVVDLKERKTLQTLSGFHEPQGVAYVPSSDTLYVTGGGDGRVRLFQGADLTPLVTIAVGDDADNIRVDDGAHRVYVGYGSGALAVIDTTARRKIADIPLKAHPEGFQLEPSGQHVYVNVPDAREVAVVDRTAGPESRTSTGRWRTPHNYRRHQ